MAEYTVTFNRHHTAKVAAGTYLTDAAVRAGVGIVQPCGGQGRCGRCAVKVVNGEVRRRSTLRLSAEEVSDGYALACQTIVLGDAQIAVPEQDTLERLLASDRLVADITCPANYQAAVDQSLRRITLTLAPPTLDDQRDDWSRLEKALCSELKLDSVAVSLPVLRTMGRKLREDDWQVTAYVFLGENGTANSGKLIALEPGHVAEDAPMWGVSVDIGTTTVTVLLVDLISGQVMAQAAEYNRQIRRGDDVISRVIFANKNNGQNELRDLVLTSINTMIDRACDKVSRQQVAAGSTNNHKTAQDEPCSADKIVKATIVGNSIMMHLLLGISAESIRQSPFVPAVNQPPILSASDVGLDIYPEAPVICLPGVASYVGADISAGVLSSGLDDAQDVTLFMDIGTNGEMVLGGHDWLVTCACSAGPAFEGAGVNDGMRATRGAIEEVWIDSNTYEPTLRVIGQEKPRGICGSGLISLLAEMFLTGVIDKGGFFNSDLPTKRIRRTESGLEYVVAWADESWHGQDIAITRVDVDNLIRAKAAIYAGISVLAESVGLPLESVNAVLIGGSFGKYINVEKAVQIGLLPDMPWENFYFLGNTAILGAYHALLSQQARQRIEAIAGRMTYIELSADNSFYEAFTSALFLPHTEASRFPSVEQLLKESENVVSDL